MPYVYSWTNATAAPGFYDWVLKGNALFDPDIAIGGNSAYGLDEIAHLYGFYKVLRSTMTVTITALDANPVQCVVIPATFSASFAAAQQDGLLVHPKGRHKTISQYNGTRSLSNRMDTATVMCVRDIDDVGFQADTGADPSHLWYWHVVTWNNDGDAVNCEVLVRIAYDVVFSGAKALSV
jgi:hypothetical protein